MLQRIFGVLMLSGGTFDDIKRDSGATGQAVLVVILVAVASAIGAGGLAFLTGGNGIMGLISGLINAIIGWVIWSVVIYLVGTLIFGGKAELGEVLRVVGFALSPQLLSLIPCLGGLVGFVWSLLALFVAIQQGLNVSTGKAIGTVVIGFVANAVLISCSAGLLGTMGALF